MATLLNRLVAESCKSQYPEPDPGVLFEAQKQLEKMIVDEVCREEAARIDRKAKILGETRRFEQGMQELKVILVQYFLLAFLVGLLVNHVYDAVKINLYSSDVSLIIIGSLVLSGLCIVVALWMVSSRIMEFYEMMMRDKGGDEVPYQ